MSRGLNNWSFSDIKHFLGKRGFHLNHIEGSHYFYVGSHEGVIRQVCVSFHGHSPQTGIKAFFTGVSCGAFMRGIPLTSVEALRRLVG